VVNEYHVPRLPVASGGIAIIYSDGTPNDDSLVDATGRVDYDGPPTGGWQHRSVDLSPAAGKTIKSFVVTMQNETPMGTWDEYFSDIEILSADGTIQQVFNGQPLNYGTWGYPGTKSPSFTVERVPLTADAPMKSTYFYLSDTLGTAQVELSAGGWPVWQGQFTPFGAELADGTTTMHYKFTGKERDAESGLDYFGARYYASSMGRFMSPDWADKPEAVPYSSLDNPQSLNLYGYVLNNPISQADPDGHCCWDKAKAWMAEHPRTAQAVGGVAKVAVGVGLVATIAGGDVPGSVVGVGLVVSGTLSAVGSVVSGVTDVAGAATNTNAEAAQKGLDGVSNLPALVTSAATGNVETGAAVGTLADAGQLAAKPMEAVKNPATMADAAKTLSSTVDLGKRAASAVRNTLSPGPPPAPKPPAMPSCSTAGACK